MDIPGAGNVAADFIPEVLVCVSVKSEFVLQKVIKLSSPGPPTDLGGRGQLGRLKRPPLFKLSSAGRVRLARAEVGRSLADGRGMCRELCGPLEASKCVCSLRQRERRKEEGTGVCRVLIV